MGELLVVYIAVPGVTEKQTVPSISWQVTLRPIFVFEKVESAIKNSILLVPNDWSSTHTYFFFFHVTWSPGLNCFQKWIDEIFNEVFISLCVHAFLFCYASFLSLCISFSVLLCIFLCLSLHLCVSPAFTALLPLCVALFIAVPLSLFIYSTLFHFANPVFAFIFLITSYLTSVSALLSVFGLCFYCVYRGLKTVW